MSKTSKTSPVAPRRVIALRPCFVDNVLRARGDKFVTAHPVIPGLFEELTPKKEREIEMEEAETQRLTLKQPPGTSKAAMAHVTGQEQPDTSEFDDPTLNV